MTSSSLFRVALYVLATGLMMTSAAAGAADQVYTPTPSAVQVDRGASGISITASYDTNPTGTNSTGSGVEIYFDSSRLSFVSLTDLCAGAGCTLVGADSSASVDAGDGDGDAATDSFVKIAWFDLGGAFPGAFPKDMFTVVFDSADGSFEGITTVNFVVTDLPPTITAGIFPPVSVEFLPNAVAPVVTPPADITVEADGPGGTPSTDAAIAAFLAGATATDDLDELDGGVTNNAPGTFPLGATTVTFSASDLSGNTGTATATVTVVDTTGPIVNPPEPIQVSAGSAQGTAASDPAIAAFLNGASAIDLVSGEVAVGNDAPTIFPLGQTIVRFSASDGEGNPGSAQSTVTVVDDVGPVISGNTTITVEAEGAAGTPASSAQLTAFFAGVTAADNVDGTVDVANDAPATFALGATEVAFSAVDTAGNESSVVGSVTVEDTTAPNVTPPADADVDQTTPDGTPVENAAVQAFLAGASASDLVDGTTVVTNNAPALLPPGATTVIFTSSDAAGNTGTATAVINVTNAVPPVVTPPADTSVEALDATGTPASDEGVQIFLAGVNAADGLDGECGPEAACTLSDNAPSRFPLGPTTVTFTATDSGGNTASASAVLTVVDTTSPEVSPPEPVVVVSQDGIGAAATQPIIAAFLAGATATDAVDPDPTIANDAPATFPVGETTVTFTATDAAGNAGLGLSSVLVLRAAAGTDTDGDGMDDAFEVENNLDPNDPADASLDSDGDGRTNLEEFQEGTDPNSDDVPPVVTAPADLVVPSEGRLTAVDLGTATAEDVLDGTLVATPDQPGPFEPGTYEITWSATDAAGNQGQDVQSLTVLPQVQVAQGPQVPEGTAVAIQVSLNGDAPSYPVIVPFTVAGTATAGVDHTLIDGEALIGAVPAGNVIALALDQNSTVIEFQVLADGVDAEGPETVEITLGTPVGDNAVAGPILVSVVTIVEDPVPPRVTITASQGGVSGAAVAAAGGTVTLFAQVDDPDGTHAFDWSQTDNNLVASDGVTDAQQYVFDPAGLDGLFTATVVVTDSDIADRDFTASLLISISAAGGGNDADGDGIPDDVDPTTIPELLPTDAGSRNDFLETEPGLRLRVGGTAFASGVAGALITENDVAQRGGQNGSQPTNGDDPDFSYPGGIFDFFVDELPVAGQSVRVVIPQLAAIPADAVYRKYKPSTGWSNFVVDADNEVASAPGQLGVCPPPGDAAYTSGLTQGHFCVQLTIEDGGPNDADGAVDNAIGDPGGVGQPPPPAPPAPPPSSGGGGGGCAVGASVNDPTLPVLLFVALGWLLRRRVVAQPARAMPRPE